MTYFNTQSKMMVVHEKMIKALIDGNIEEIKTLLNPPDPDQMVPDINGEIQDTPFILFAAKRKNWDIVAELFNRGAEIDVCNHTFKWHLIHEALLQASDKIFNILAEECDLNVATVDGVTPLMLGIDKNLFDRVDIMLNTNNVEISMLNNIKENAGHYAARKENYDLLVKLVEMGMPYDQKNKQGKTPLDLIEDLIVRDSIKGQIEELKNKVNIREAKQFKKYSPEDNHVEDIKPIVEKVEAPKKELSGLSKIKRS